MAQEQNNPIEENLLSDINVKLRDIEEKQSIIKDRVLLIGENLVSEKEQTDIEIKELKLKLYSLVEEIRKIKLSLQLILDNTNNFAKKNELEILQRQFAMFQPLELARISDVEAIINKKIKSLGSKNN